MSIRSKLIKAQIPRETWRSIDPDFCKIKELEYYFNEFYSDLIDDNEDELINLCLDAVFTVQFVTDFTKPLMRRRKGLTDKEWYDMRLNFSLNVNGTKYKLLDFFLMSEKELDQIRYNLVGSSELTTTNYNFKTTAGGHYDGN